ncbi:hypothetical protein OHC33_003532 [Knufia fluminis]|uniref:Amino acid permease n=1 Tax=Knufia fluminis TaxID=191047 RepID=A0AAN8EU44_9EURO|nr:hypothetical protein OHC33_003532 [Knufia fluminis]
MSDEVKDAQKKVPLAMVYSVIINGAMAFSFIIVLLFCLGDLEETLNTPTGYPIIQVVYNATGSKAATSVFTVFILFNATVSMFSSLASVSRLTWAFAKDNGLPFSRFFSAVHPTLRIPINALGLVAFIIILIQLINVGSTSALYAVVSLSTIGLYLSYVLPILFFVLAKLRGDYIAYGPFKLGHVAGLATNIFAVLYGIFVLIWLPFPPYMPVTGENMNYAGPILLAVIIFALIDWFVSGRKRFVVPDETLLPRDS